MSIKIRIVAFIIKPELFLFINYNRLGDRKDKKFKKYGVLLGNILL
jgi:DNA phosphorothioation-dependent restriction protein DptG